MVADSAVCSSAILVNNILQDEIRDLHGILNIGEAAGIELACGFLFLPHIEKQSSGYYISAWRDRESVRLLCRAVFFEKSPFLAGDCWKRKN